MLTARLRQVVAVVPRAEVVADIGTDHAYVPIRLVRDGIVTRAVATDVREGPLAAAREHIRRRHLQQHITCRRGDGLKVIRPGEADGVIMAGMGGEMMTRIWAESPQVVAALRFAVLQPMSRYAQVRRMLRTAGWHLADEWLVAEKNKIYRVMYAVNRAEEEQRYPALMDEVGARLWEKRDPLLGDLLTRMVRQKTRLRDGLLQAQRPRVDAAGKADILAAEIRQLEEWIWQYKSEIS